MRFGPRDRRTPQPEDSGPEEAGPETAPRPGPYPEDVHVAGKGIVPEPSSEPALDPAPAEPPSDWVPVQPPPEPENEPWTPHMPPPAPPPAETPAAHEDPLWAPRETPPGFSPGEPATGESWTPRETGPAPTGRHARSDDEPFLPGKGLSAEPPSVTAPDIPAPQWEPPQQPGPMSDPERRRAMADAFVAEFVGSPTWRATLAVLESAFPGLGMASTLSRRTDELWQTMDALDRTSAAKLGVPAWLDEAGIVLDLSARLGVRAAWAPMPGLTRPPRASRPYAGAFVIDTLDPLRYHRAVGGPQAPRDLPGDGPLSAPSPSEDDDSGVVIVANLTSAGVRVLDSVALWRYAGRVVTGTVREAGRPETRIRARRALRALRRVVVVDPDLGLGLCLQIDAARVPRCLLAFRVDRTAGAPRFVRP
ncbi:hypothetical protein [Actinomadura sp. WMMA1423]|uniref:hypothetical protein n=1 Tax=Actinomadura sp. WMMA1423 TaxID=2591108 RepID=UPI001146DEFE|nr:hypothetical protein [Actinomadura sp. WMMA1423]